MKRYSPKRFRELVSSFLRVTTAVLLVILGLVAFLSYPDYAQSQRIAEFCAAVPIGTSAADVLADAARDPEFHAENREDRLVRVKLGRHSCFLWLENGRVASRRDRGYND